MSGIDIEGVWNRLDGRQQVHVYDIMCDLANMPKVAEHRGDKDWLTIAEACEYTGYGRTTIERAISSGHLHPRVPKGVTKGRRVSRAELDEWISGR